MLNHFQYSNTIKIASEAIPRSHPVSTVGSGVNIFLMENEKFLFYTKVTLSIVIENQLRCIKSIDRTLVQLSLTFIVGNRFTGTSKDSSASKCILKIVGMRFHECLRLTTHTFSARATEIHWYRKRRKGHERSRAANGFPRSSSPRIFPSFEQIFRCEILINLSRVNMIIYRVEQVIIFQINLVTVKLKLSVFIGEKKNLKPRLKKKS